MMRDKSLLVLILLSLAPACGERADLWETSLQITGPYQVANQALWVDSTRGLVFAIDPGATSPAVQTQTIRRNATFCLSSPAGDNLFILTSGKENRLKDQTAEEPGLTIIKPIPNGAPEVVRFYPISGAFDRLAVSGDGKLAVAYYSTNQNTGTVFRNPNELALLDLTQDPGPDNPVLRTIRSFGSAPLGVVFSPEMPIPAPNGVTRTLAVILADNNLTFLDMTQRKRKEITVPLAQPESNQTVKPQQVTFSPLTGTVLVRAEGVEDIFALSLGPAAKKDLAPEDNDYWPSINQPSAGKTAQDMILFSDGGKDWILTANASQDLALIEAATSQFSIIPVGEPVDAILPVPADNPTLAVIYSQRQPQSRIHFLTLKDIAKNLENNLISRNLEQPVHQLVAMPNAQQALVVHDNHRTVASILDLVGTYHTITPLQGEFPLESFDFVESESQGAFLVGVSAKISRLGLLNLTQLHPRDLRLDDYPQKVIALGEHIIVDHGQPQGLVTIIPTPLAGREESHQLWGIFMTDLLDRELKD